MSAPKQTLHPRMHSTMWRPYYKPILQLLAFSGQTSGMRWVIEVTVELSLVEGIVGEGYHRSIVVWEGLKRDVGSLHRWCPYCYPRGTEGERPPSPIDSMPHSPICAFTDAIGESHRGIAVIIVLVPRCSVGMRRRPGRWSRIWRV